jgi:hypothetical protein
MFRLNIDEAGRFALPGFSFVETTLSSALGDHASSLPPEIPKPVRRQCRIDGLFICLKTLSNFWISRRNFAEIIPVL